MRNLKEKGITLIALIISVIVLLIMIGIATVLLTGTNGILNQAIEAKFSNDIAKAKEKVQLEVLGSLNMKELKENLEANLGIKQDEIEEDENGNITFFIDGYKTTVDTEGKIEMEDTKTKIDSEPTLAEKLTAVNYGDSVDYKRDLNNNSITTDDWKILYRNKETGYTFLIANNFLAQKNIPTAAENAGITKCTNSAALAYGVCFGNKITSKTGMSDISAENAKKFMIEGFKNSSYGNCNSNNAKATAVMLDSSLWTDLLSSDIEGAEAIGGPTIEMWVSSWNEKGYKPLYCNNYSTYGYYIGSSDTPTTTDFIAGSAFDSTGATDTLYYPNTSSLSGCDLCWFASPGAAESTAVMHIRYDGRFYYLWGGLPGDASINWITGLRPVICLPPNVKGELNGSGVWELSQ